MKILRKFREEQYEKLIDAVYKKRRWTKGRCPTLELLKELGIDFKDVLQYIKV